MPFDDTGGDASYNEAIHSMTLLSIIIAIAIIAFLMVARPRIFQRQPSVPVTNLEDALKIKQDATKAVGEIKQKLEQRP